MAEPIVVKPFAWAHWAALWKLVVAHLAEHGIILDAEEEISPIHSQEPDQVVRGEGEWDLDYVGVIYLRGAGGFWLAWQGTTPVGHVGARVNRTGSPQKDCRSYSAGGITGGSG